MSSLNPSLSAAAFAVVMPLSGPEPWFGPNFLELDRKVGPKLGQLLDRTESPVRRSGRRRKCRTCPNSVRTEPYIIQLTEIISDRPQLDSAKPHFLPTQAPHFS